VTGRTVLQGEAADLADDRDMQRNYLGLETPA
jgi:ABC-type branched-subunit amino acid transport system ATPase component